jgi:hypothetical protein
VLSAVFRRSAEEGWAIVSHGSPPIDTNRREGKVLQSVLGLYDTLVDQGEAEVADGHEASDQDQLDPNERIVWERITGASLGQIANGLNRDGVSVPGRSGGWLPSAVWAELETLRPRGGGS